MKNEQLNNYIANVVAYCNAAYLHLTEAQVAALAKHIAKYRIKNDKFIVQYPMIYRNSFGQVISLDPDETPELIPLDSERSILEGVEIANKLFDC